MMMLRCPDCGAPMIIGRYYLRCPVCGYTVHRRDMNMIACQYIHAVELLVNWFKADQIETRSGYSPWRVELPGNFVAPWLNCLSIPISAGMD